VFGRTHYRGESSKALMRTPKSTIGLDKGLCFHSAPEPKDKFISNLANDRVPAGGPRVPEVPIQCARKSLEVGTTPACRSAFIRLFFSQLRSFPSSLFHLTERRIPLQLPLIPMSSSTQVRKNAPIRVGMVPVIALIIPDMSLGDRSAMTKASATSGLFTPRERISLTPSPNVGRVAVSSDFHLVESFPVLSVAPNQAIEARLSTLEFQC
jgi:hypothetical protein